MFFRKFAASKTGMQQAKELRAFLFSQQLADGLRITAAILLPAFLLYQFGLLATGMTISLGAMCVSLTDAPGPIIHRRNGMLITAFTAFAVALLTAIVRVNVYTLGVEITALTFLLSLLQVYGMRAASVGNAAILVMVLTMGQPRTMHPLLHAGYILGGSLWYMLLALFFYYIRPYRPAQRVLGDCIREMASYLSIKAFFYDVHTNLQDNYEKMVAQQIVVSEKQDAVRELFFKTARIVTETTPMGKRLVATFVHTVDLFEDITATYYNYSTLRNRFAQRGILKHVATLINSLATELDHIGIAIQTNTKPPAAFVAADALSALKKEIDAIQEQEPEENTLILKKILVNIRRMTQRIQDIHAYFNPAMPFIKSNVDHTLFIGHQPLDPKVLLHNLNSTSTAFKHAVRISVACLIGFTISKLLAYGQHSYWILLTIAFILKPAFSLTKTRNIDRILGTVAGVLIGAAILFFIKNTTAHFVLMVLLMLGAYTFLRTWYVVMVICTTAYIVILFQFLNIPFITVVQERVFDTVLGCVIAFSAGYFLFPDWEAHQIKNHMADVLTANAVYLQNVTQALEGAEPDRIEYKLARKTVYVQSANLSAAYQRMVAEPKSRQYDKTVLHQFMVRNHLLFSNIAHLATLLQDAPQRTAYPLAARTKKAAQKLEVLSKKLNSETLLPEPNNATAQTHIEAMEETATEDMSLKTSVDFIVKLCDDIEVTTKAILAT